MSATPSSRFWLHHAVYPFLLFALLAILFEGSNIDLSVSDHFYDFHAQAWKFKDAWWSEGLLHLGGRELAVAFFLFPLAVWILSFFRESWKPWRRSALYLVLAISLGTGSVALVKHIVNRHCPWDIVRYGGDIPYTKLSDTLPASCRKGNCFPAGHASAGFSLVSGYFIYYRRDKRKALGFLLLGLLVGSLFGFAQIARGAHFVSHNIWSLALCWYMGLGLFAGPFRSSVAAPVACLQFDGHQVKLTEPASRSQSG